MSNLTNYAKNDRKYFGKFEDRSKRYFLQVKALMKNEAMTPKISIEIISNSDGKDIRSYRTANRLEIENLIVAQCSAFAFYLKEMGFFDLPEGKKHELNLAFSILMNKIKAGMKEAVGI